MIDKSCYDIHDAGLHLKWSHARVHKESCDGSSLFAWRSWCCLIAGYLDLWYAGSSTTRVRSRFECVVVTWRLLGEHFHSFQPNSSRFSRFWISNDYVSFCIQLLHQPLPSAAPVCVCVESTANTPGISIFGSRRLWQRGKRSTWMQLVGGACYYPSVCATFLKI